MALYKLAFRNDDHVTFVDQQDLIAYCRSWAASEESCVHNAPCIYRLTFGDAGICRPILSETESDILDERIHCPVAMPIVTRLGAHTLDIPDLGEDFGPGRMNGLSLFQVNVDWEDLQLEVDEDRGTTYFVVAKDEKSALEKFGDLPVSAHKWIESNHNLCWWNNPYMPKHTYFIEPFEDY